MLVWSLVERKVFFDVKFIVDFGEHFSNSPRFRSHNTMTTSALVFLQFYPAHLQYGNPQPAYVSMRMQDGSEHRYEIRRDEDVTIGTVRIVVKNGDDGLRTVHVRDGQRRLTFELKPLPTPAMWVLDEFVFHPRGSYLIPANGAVAMSFE